MNRCQLALACKEAADAAETFFRVLDAALAQPGCVPASQREAVDAALSTVEALHTQARRLQGDVITEED